MNDQKQNIANRAMDRITMPSALLSCLLFFPLRGQEQHHKQVGAGVIGDVDMVAVLSTSKAVFWIVFFITSLASGMKSKWEAEERAG